MQDVTCDIVNCGTWQHGYSKCIWWNVNRKPE